MGSAYYTLGKIHLEKQRREEAIRYFEMTSQVMKEFLLKLLEEKGQHEIQNDIKVEELIKPSIFDDERISGLKQTLGDVEADILECKQLDVIQPELDKMKNEAKEQAEKGNDSNVPEGFGQP